MRTQASRPHARRRKSSEPPAPPTPGGGGPIQASRPARADERGSGEELKLEKTARSNWMGQIKHRANPSPSCSPSCSTRGAGRGRLPGVKADTYENRTKYANDWGMRTSSRERRNDGHIATKETGDQTLPRRFSKQPITPGDTALDENDWAIRKHDNKASSTTPTDEKRGVMIPHRADKETPSHAASTDTVPLPAPRIERAGREAMSRRPHRPRHDDETKQARYTGSRTTGRARRTGPRAIATRRESDETPQPDRRQGRPHRHRPQNGKQKNAPPPMSMDGERNDTRDG